MKPHLLLSYVTLLSIGIMPVALANQSNHALDSEEVSSETTVEKAESEEVEQPVVPITNIPQIDEIEHPLTNAAGLLYPSPPPNQLNSQGLQISQSTIQVTDIQLKSTASGFEVILETADGSSPQVFTSSSDRTLILQVVNAQLNLRNGRNQFRADNPFEGVASVTARTLDARTIEVRVTGTEKLLTAKINSFGTGLIVGFKTSTDVGKDEEIIDIVVTATRREEAVEDVARSVTVINREEIQEQIGTSASNNLSDIVGQLVPGLSAPSKMDRRNLNMRGRPTLVLIDGVVQNANASFDLEFNSIAPEAIERIEVVRGPSSLYGSGATGGIINIITRQPTEELFENEIAVGVSNSIGDEVLPEDGFGYRVQYSLSGNEDVIDLRVNASLDKINALYDGDGDVIPALEVGEKRSVNLLSKMGLDFNEEERLELTYNIYDDRQGRDVASDPSIAFIPGAQKARPLERGEIDFENKPRQTNQVASLRYTNEDFLNSALDMQVFFQKNEFDFYLEDLRPIFRALLRAPDDFVFPDNVPAIYQRISDEQKWGVKLQIESNLSETANILWGVDYTQEESEQKNTYIDPVAFDEKNEANVIGEGESTPFFILNSVGVFAQARWDMSEKMILSSGVRYENINADIDDWTGDTLINTVNGSLFQGQPLPELEGGTQNEDDVVFNLGAVYKLSSEMSLFANFAQGFAVPDFGILASAQTGFDLEDTNVLDPEKVNNYEIGVRGNWDRFQFTLASFYNHSDKGLNVAVDENGIGFLSRAPQRNYGVEATMDWQPSDSWSFGGTVTWNEGDTDNGNDNRGWVPLSSENVEGIKLTLYLQNETLPGWRNRLQMLLVGDRSRAFDQEADAFLQTGYTVLDLISSVKIGEGKLVFSIENLLDRQYVPVSSQRSFGVTEFRRAAAPGRTLSIRYLMKF